MTRGENIRAAGIRMYGSEEAWKAELRKRGSLGGKAEREEPRGFARDKEFASKVGKIGGRVSRRSAGGFGWRNAANPAQDES